jgi:hypothetical protein
MATPVLPLFETRELVGVMSQLKAPKTFLLDTYFPTIKVHNTKSFDIDIFKGKRRVAPYVKPIAEGKVVDRLGFTTNSFSPPYIKPKMSLTAEDLGLRLPGNTIYETGMGPSQMASAAVGDRLAQMEEMILRAEEIQASQALQTGKVTITGEGYSGLEVDFLFPGTHLVTLAGADLWSAVTGTPMEDLREWRELVIQDSGIAPDTLILGRDAWKYFRAREFSNGGSFDQLRVQLGQIDPKHLAPGVIYLGYFNEIGVDVYQYQEWYLDSASVEQPMVGVNNVILASSKANTARHYGMIQDLASSGALKRFPKNWITEDPSVLWVMLQSAPLMAIHQPDAFFRATVHV